MTGPHTVPPEIRAQLNTLLLGDSVSWDALQCVMYMGHKAQGTGTDVLLRFLASRATNFVVVHVQSDAVGAGGFDYDRANYVSSTRIDCRATKLQQVTISRNGTNQYWVFLIPLFEY